MSMTIYLCEKAVTNIPKLVMEYKKIQEIKRMRLEIEYLNRVSESLLLYTNLIQNDIISLMHVYFKSAYENLQYALNSEGINRIDYLKQARNRFIDALSIEKNENLILTFLGLSMCQLLLDDLNNYQITFNKIFSVSFDSSTINWENDTKFFDYMNRSIRTLIPCIMGQMFHYHQPLKIEALRIEDKNLKRYIELLISQKPDFLSTAKMMCANKYAYTTLRTEQVEILKDSIRKVLEN